MKYKKIENTNSQSGFALILTLVVMAAMTAVGLATLTNSTTDVLITRNEKESRRAFTIAEMGIDDALNRMGLPMYVLDVDGNPTTDPPTPNPRRVGETLEDRKNRGAFTPTPGNSNNRGTIPYTFGSYPTGLNSYNVPGLNEGDIGGAYRVTVNYTYEDAEYKSTWCSKNEVVEFRDPNPVDTFIEYEKGCNTVESPDIVLFCKGFGFTGGGAMKKCGYAEPVYEIVSKGITNTGSEAVVKVYVSASTLNVVPPGESILFTEENIGLANGKTINSAVTAGGRAAAKNLSNSSSIDPTPIKRGGLGSLKQDADKPCQETNNDGDVVNVYCISANDTEDVVNWKEGMFDDYLGLPFSDLKSYADYTDFDGETGKMCADADVLDDEKHICGNDSVFIYVEGLAKLTSLTGRGVVIVDGDLEISGNFAWEGFIYVTGKASFAGTADIWGALMIKGTGAETAINRRGVHITGDLAIRGSIPVATSVANVLGISRVIRWSRE